MSKTKATKKIELVSCMDQWKSLIGHYVNYVYLYIDENDHVLYIGKTNDVEKRWGEHCRAGKKDISKVKLIEAIAYSSPAEAAFAEIQGILFYDPPWNDYPITGVMSRIKIPSICRNLFEVVE